MPLDVSAELGKLAIAQAITQTQLDSLSKAVADYISHSEKRCDEETDDKLETARLLTQCATTLEDVKEAIKELKTKDIPAIQQENTKLAAKVSTHDWWVKAAIGATVIASLGAAWSGLSSCNVGEHSHYDRTEQVSKLDR